MKNGVAEGVASDPHDPNKYVDCRVNTKQFKTRTELYLNYANKGSKIKLIKIRLMFDEFGRVKGKNTWYKMIHENCKLIFCAKGISNLNEKCYFEKKIGS